MDLFSSSKTMAGDGFGFRWLVSMYSVDSPPLALRWSMVMQRKSF